MTHTRWSKAVAGRQGIIVEGDRGAQARVGAPAHPQGPAAEHTLELPDALLERFTPFGMRSAPVEGCASLVSR